MTEYRDVRRPGVTLLVGDGATDEEVHVYVCDSNFAGVGLEISLADFHRAAFEVLGPGVVQPPSPPKPDTVEPGQVWRDRFDTECTIARPHEGRAAFTFISSSGELRTGTLSAESILDNWTFVRHESEAS